MGRRGQGEARAQGGEERGTGRAHEAKTGGRTITGRQETRGMRRAHETRDMITDEETRHAIEAIASIIGVINQSNYTYYFFRLLCM